MNNWWKPTQNGVVPDGPWLSPEVTGYMEKLLKPEFTVLEHGSGGSTLWFADRVKKVTAVESDLDWFSIVSAKAPANVKMIYHAAGLPKLTGKYDIILIDGEPLEDRGLWLMAAEKYIKPNGIIILDNYNRPEYAAERKKLADAYIHRSFNAPVGLYLNTEFYFTGGQP